MWSISLRRGLDLCSPWGLFLVDGVAAGGGSSSRLPCLAWCSSARLSASPSPLVGWPIRVQRLKSVLVGAPGRWILRLLHALRSSGGGVEDLGFGSIRASQPSGSKERRKMNTALKGFLVISISFGVLFVRRGCTVLLFNIFIYPFAKKDASGCESCWALLDYCARTYPR